MSNFFLNHSYVMNFRGLNLTLENKSFWDNYDDLLSPAEDVLFETYDLPLSFIVLVLLLYGIVSVTSFGGNIVVCYTLCNGKVLLTVTNFFLASLSVSDILMTILCIPTTIISDIIYKHWVLGSFMCHVLHYLQLVAVLQRTFSVVAITCDRHFVISRPLKKRMTKKTARLLVLLLWILAFIIALPSAWYSQVIYLQYQPGSHGLCIELWDDQQLQHIYSVILLLLQYFMPLLIMICVYVHIGYIIWIKPTPGEADKVRDKRIALSKRKSLKILFILVSVYALTWLPIHIMTIIGDLNPTLYDHRFAHIIWLFFHWLAFSNTGINPMIYCWINKTFRSQLKQVWCFSVCRRLKARKERRKSIEKSLERRRRKASKQNMQKLNKTSRGWSQEHICV